jgi:hypothetical protein
LYFQTEIYDFSQPTSFSGKSWYNPYRNWDSENLLKANFHAHAKAWGGVTNGGNTQKELENFYRNLHYGVAATSNYHSPQKPISKQLADFRVYEHGYNIFKSHKLALGVQKAIFLDFPFFQNTSHKQLIINKILNIGGLVAIAHPNFHDGHSKEDLKKLRGYQFIEIRSRYANAVDYWDSALQSGHAVWCLANDDTHDLAKEKAGRFFNQLSLSSINDIRETLKSGQFVSVVSEEGMSLPVLKKITVNENKLDYEFSELTDTLFLVENGERIILPEAKGSILLKQTTNYIRFEAKNNDGILYTNPIFRNASETKLPKVSLPTLNLFKTLLYKASIILISIALLLLVLKLRRISVLKK